MKRINNDWKYVEEFTDSFLHNDIYDKIVRIPHSVADLPLHNIDEKDYQKIVGYKKELKIEKKENKRYFLQFDGVAHFATVYFNNTLLTTHACGYTAFRVEITDLIQEINEVVVVCDSHESLNIPPFGFVIDYLTYGGIYRDVWLDEKEKSFIEDVYIHTPDLHTAICDMTYNNVNCAKCLTVEIRDKDNFVVASYTGCTSEKSITINCANVLPWSPETPNLYKAVFTLENGDTKEITFGFRTIGFDENNFILNGKPYFIQGLNRHQSYPYMGYSAPQRLQEDDAYILKNELHVNSVRTSHYPQSQYFLDACDKLGLLVFTEFPGWQHLGDDAWKEQVLTNTKEMILQYRNHPSIYLWGVRINESLDDDALYTRTNEIAHALDPYRFTGGVRYLDKSNLLEDVYTYNDFSHNGKTPGCKKKKDVLKKEDLKRPLLISECNGHMFPTKPTDRIERLQEHALRHARVMNDAKKDKEHVGIYEWCMFDYGTHKDFGSGDRTCYHGVLDSFRNFKLAASVYASQTDDEPVLEVASNMNIGDYDGGRLPQFYCFTNGDCIKLYKNDQYVQTFYPSTSFSALKHGPILIDDFIGDLLKENEGLSGTQEKFAHDALHSAALNGLENMPLQDKAKLAYCMARYKMKYETGVELYSKYVGGWGGDSTEWRFDAVKDNTVIKSVVKKFSTKMHLDVTYPTTELLDTDTYDVLPIRIRLLDEYNNLSNYTNPPVMIQAEGPLEIIGPSIITLEGGMSGTYIKTTGTGNGTVTITSSITEPVTITLHVKGE